MTQPNIAGAGSSIIGVAGVRLVPMAGDFARSSIRQLTPEMRRLQREVDRLTRGSFARGTKDANDFRRGILASTLAVSGLRGAVLAAGTGFLGGAALVTGFERVIRLARDFEREMNTFQAVAQSSGVEMNRAAREAVRLGRDISLPNVSARDAAQAMTELARGGLSVQDAIAGTRGVLQLATAANLSFADSAQIAARALNAFGLAGEESVRVADVLANSANASTAEIDDMAFAFQQASAVAHQQGLSIEELAAGLTIMARAGIVGSDAGTSFRTMLLRLVPATKSAREMMNSLGVETEDVHGNILPLADVMEQYRLQLLKVTPAERQHALQVIFGADAIRAATLFTRTSRAEFERFVRIMERSGTAAEVAAARNKGLSGALDALSSNLQTIAVTAGGTLLPALTDSVRSLNRFISSMARNQRVQEAATNTMTLFGDSANFVISTLEILGPLIGLIAFGFEQIVSTIGAGPLLAAAAAFFAVTKGAAAFARIQSFVITQTVRGAAVQARTIIQTQGLSQAQITLGLSAEGAAIKEEELAAAIAAGDGPRARAIAQTLELQQAQRAAAQEQIIAPGAERTTTSGIILPSGVGRDMEDLGKKTATTTQKFGLFARGLTSAIGQTALIGGAMFAATAGITFLLTRESEAEKATKAFEESIRNLANAQQEAEQTARDLADAEDELAISQGKVNELTREASAARRDVIATTPNTAQEAQAQQRLAGILRDLAKARRDLADTEADLEEKRQKRLAEIEKERVALNTLKNTLFDVTTAREREAAEDLLLIGVAADRESETRQMEDSTAALKKQADQLRQNRPLLAHNIDLLIQLRQQLRRPLTRQEISIVLNNQRLEGSLRVGDQLLTGFLQKWTRNFERPLPLEVLDPFNKVLQGPSDEILRGQGRNWSREQAAGYIEGIETEESRMVASLKETLANVVAEGEKAIQQAIADASQNLFSIGQTINGMISQMIDAGPLGTKIKRLQEQLDAQRNDNQRLRLERDLRNAREDLAERREQLDPLRSGGLDPEQQRRRQRDITRFLRPAKETVQDAIAAVKDFNAQTLIDSLQKVVDKQKEVVERGLNDLIAAYESRKIDFVTFQRRLGRLLGTVTGPYKRAGTNLGLAFRLQYEAQVKGILGQAQAISAPRFRQGVPQVNIIRPLEVEQKAANDKLEALKSLEKAQNDLAKKNNVMTGDMLRLLRGGIKIQQARIKVARIHEGEIVVTVGGRPRK